MNGKPPYRNWVGVLLGILLHGSAHFLSGNRKAGIKWYFGLIACDILIFGFLATPGTTPCVLGAIFCLAGVVLWFVMLRQSYRPVPRIGFLGWLAVIAVAFALSGIERLAILQFVRPFKLSTGSMQPTLMGVHGYDVAADSPDRPGRMSWLISGTRFREVKTTTEGFLTYARPDQFSPSELVLKVGSRTYQVPRFAHCSKQPGEHVAVGETLWSGVITAGDHMFAERLSYFFGKPKRGDIVVFRTDGIKDLPPHTVYVMRVAGLPGERIRIEPPFLIANDQKVTEPKIFSTISSASDGYDGFKLVSAATDALIREPTDEVALGENEYFLLGDNTGNSRDSRYWGAIPEKNIIGRVTRIYWPFTRLNALKGE